MCEQIEWRLGALMAEYETGQNMQRGLEACQ